MFLAFEKIMTHLATAIPGAAVENQAVGVHFQKAGDAATRPFDSFEQLNAEGVIGVGVGALAGREQRLKHVADSH